MLAPAPAGGEGECWHLHQRTIYPNDFGPVALPNRCYSSSRQFDVARVSTHSVLVDKDRLPSLSRADLHLALQQDKPRVVLQLQEALQAALGVRWVVLQLQAAFWLSSG